MNRTVAILFALSLSLVALFATHAGAVEKPPKLGWNWLCQPAGERSVDPIVAPGVEPVHHDHVFYNSVPGKNDYTVDRIRKLPRGCVWPHNPRLDPRDQNLYWIPSRIVEKDTGDPVEVGQLNAYYRLPQGIPQERVRTPPTGLRVVVGRADAEGKQTGINWRCPASGKGSSLPLDCAGKTKNVKLSINVPPCSDGRKDSPDHRSHLRWPTKNGCPKSHPRPIPALSMDFTIRTDDATNIRFEDHHGMRIAPHGDFYNATRPEVWDDVMDRCLRVSKNVGGCEGTGKRGTHNPS